jgi:hypothetical protein
MIPETSTARTVELYRADRFPDKWVLESVLLRDINASDTTILRDKNRWWMFAATSERQCSGWDALSLFHASDLRGPWIPHWRNPVLINRAAARPAGAAFKCQGSWWRPAQNCSNGYGAALSLCSIDHLNEGQYAQSERAVVRPNQVWARAGMHTLNWVDGLEVIDGFG